MNDQGQPEGVEPIGIEDLSRLGIDSKNQLFWDGKRIEVRRPLDLTKIQKAFAIVVTLFAVLGGIGGFCSGLADGAAFLCERNLHWLSCPAPQSAARP